MIAGFILSAYLQLSMVSGFTFLPDTAVLNTQDWRDQVNLPPQAVELNVSADRDFGPFSLNMFGSSTTYMEIKSLDSATAFSLSWSVGLSLSYKNIDIGYTRSCHHPFSAFVVETTDTAESLSLSGSEGVSRQFYVRINIGGKDGRD